jgi:hypothetical protein
LLTGCTKLKSTKYKEPRQGSKDQRPKTKAQIQFT